MTIIKTFKDFLKTGSDETDIPTKCAQFLKASDGTPLYRGYGFKLGAVINGAREVDIRKDRKPRDSGVEVHDLMDAYFLDKFGHKVRSEGFFATGDIDTAKRYGSPYYIFPVGNFKFVWGEYEGEPVVDTLNVSREIERRMITSKRSDIPALTKHIMDMVTWHTGGDLTEALRSGAEIAILADSAIIVPVGKTPYSEIIKR